MSQPPEQELTETQKEMVRVLANPHVAENNARNLPRVELPIRPRGIELLIQSRAALHKWMQRYANSDHAKAAVHESRLIIEAIDDFLLHL